MVEIFQGAKREVKREVNEWFAANPGVSIRYVLQDVAPGYLQSELTLTIIYDGTYYPVSQEAFEEASA